MSETAINSEAALREHQSNLESLRHGVQIRSFYDLIDGRRPRAGDEMVFVGKGGDDRLKHGDTVLFSYWTDIIDEKVDSDPPICCCVNCRNGFIFRTTPSRLKAIAQVSDLRTDIYFVCLQDLERSRVDDEIRNRDRRFLDVPAPAIGNRDRDYRGSER